MSTWRIWGGSLYFCNLETLLAILSVLRELSSFRALVAFTGNGILVKFNTSKT